jgi:hypothetical protein
MGLVDHLGFEAEHGGIPFVARGITQVLDIWLQKIPGKGQVALALCAMSDINPAFPADGDPVIESPVMRGGK